MEGEKGGRGETRRWQSKSLVKNQIHNYSPLLTH